MWSFVGKKTNPRWLWHTVTRSTGQVLAYVFGRRKDAVFKELKELLELFGTARIGGEPTEDDLEQNNSSSTLPFQHLEVKFYTFQTSSHLI